MKSDRFLKNLYKSIDKEYKTAVKDHLKSTEENIMKSSNKNMFFSYVKKKLKNTPYIPPLVTSDGSVILDPQDKANILNSLFASIFTIDTSNQDPHLSPWTSEFDSMESFLITTNDVHDAIASLKNTASRSPDGIPCIFLKKTINTITKPLTIIFNFSLSSGKVPNV